MQTLPYALWSSNKQGLISLTTTELEKKGCPAINASGDADVDIVNAAVEASEHQPTTVTGEEDTDLLVLLLYYAGTSNRGPYFRSDKSKATKVWSLREIEGRRRRRSRGRSSEEGRRRSRGWSSEEGRRRSSEEGRSSEEVRRRSRGRSSEEGRRRGRSSDEGRRRSRGRSSEEGRSRGRSSEEGRRWRSRNTVTTGKGGAVGTSSLES
ncbi:unnamed protein product [Arctogadus glacialis]